MNGRSNVTVFFLFALLGILLLMQIWGMVQSDRVYEQLNRLAGNMGRTQGNRPAVQAEVQDIGDTEGRYIGDEGDWLVWRLGAEPKTLNNLHTAAGMAVRYIVSGNINESLLRYNPDTAELEPWLAESYEVSDDGMEIEFTIRDDVQFSDGTPITADDVIFTFNTIMNPKIDAAPLRSYYSTMERVEKIDDRRVRFVMNQLYFKSVEFAGGMDIYPKHIYEFNDPTEFNQRISNPVGSGPYVFEKWDVGDSVVLVRNENYWGEKPKIERIVYRFITNDTAAIQALRAGKIDYMRPLPEQFTDLAEDETFIEDFYALSYWHPGVGYFWMGWNQDRPFFADRRVRLAMTLMLDRQAILDHVLDNPEAQIPTGPFYIYSDQSAPDVEPWPYDPQRARELLDEAGWIDSDGDGIRDKDGVPFRFKYMIVGNTSLHEQMGKILKDSAAKMGIQVDLDPYEWSIFITRLQERDFDAVNLAWGGGIESDPYQIWHSSQIEGGGSNYIGFNNPEADQLIEEARRTLDEKKRNELYHEFHRLIHYEQPYTFIYTRPEQRFLDRRFTNVKVHELGLDEHEWYVPLKLQKYE